MNKRLAFAISLLLCAAVAGEAGAQSITPVNGGLVNATEPVNISPGGQIDPRVSGDLASYTDFSVTAGEVRYYNFLTGVDVPIPTGVRGEIDTLSSIDGTRIAFSRQTIDRTAIIVFDVAAFTSTEIDPQAGSQRFAPAIGGRIVAFTDFVASAYGAIVVHDLLTHTTTNLAPGIGGSNRAPKVAPDGNTVVWQNCDPGFAWCEVYAAFYDSVLDAWSAPRPVSRELICDPRSGCQPAPVPSGFALNPDTDGTWIVYQSDRASPTGQDIYFMSMTDRFTRRLAIAGVQLHATIDQGVIAFQSKESAPQPADLFVYVIASNRLYQITATPTVDESLSDVTVLPNGDVRVIWAANDDVGGQGNIYAATFTPHRVLAIDSVSQAEGDNGTTAFTFTVSVLPAGVSTVTVDYITADGTATTADGDYVLVSGTLTFGPGQTSKPITVLVNGDTRFEGNETFSVVLSNPLHAIVSTNQGVGIGTIGNDDTVLPVLSIGDVANAEGHSGTTLFTFTVSLSAASTQTVNVNYVTTDGGATVADGDYLTSIGNLTFAPGETGKTITVLVNGDTKFEADEAFTVVLSNPINATISAPQGTGTIQNDDTGDTTPPRAQSIVRAGTSPTNANSVSWIVTFSENVIGVDVSDFTVFAVGITGASISTVTGSTGVYTVTANTGTGSGTLTLQLVDDDSIRDAANNPLGGVGVGNGNAIGAVFTIDRTPAAAVRDLIGTLSNPGLGLKTGQINSLTDKLNNVLASIQQGLYKQAINQLEAFINEVQAAKSTGKMSAAAAATLIAAASAIIATLS